MAVEEVPVEGGVGARVVADPLGRLVPATDPKSDTGDGVCASAVVVAAVRPCKRTQLGQAGQYPVPKWFAAFSALAQQRRQQDRVGDTFYHHPASAPSPP